MDPKVSDAYVAKLLEQLEELKKKKARRMQKLKKLEKHHRKESISINSGDRSGHAAPLQNIQNMSQTTHCPYKEKQDCSTKIKYSTCTSCINSYSHNCIRCATKVSSENPLTLDNNRNANCDTEAKPSNSCLDKTSESATFCKNEVPRTSVKIKRDSCTEQHTVDLFSESSDCDEVLNQNIKDLTDSIILNQTLNGSGENRQKMGKRSSSEVSESEENFGGESKKFKASQDVIPLCAKNQCDNIAAQNYLKMNDPVNLPSDNNEQLVDGKGEQCQTSSKSYEDGVDDALSHNMTCFMSPDMLIGAEDIDAAQAVSIKTKVSLKKSKDSDDCIKPVCILKENISNLASIANCMDSILSSVSPVIPNNDKVSDSMTSDSHCPKNISTYESVLRSHSQEESQKNSENLQISDIGLITNKAENACESSDSASDIPQISSSEAEKLHQLCVQIDIPLDTSSKFKPSTSDKLNFEEPSVEIVDELQPNSVTEKTFSSPKDSKSLDCQDSVLAWTESEIQWECVEGEDEVDDNPTPSLLESTFTDSQVQINNKGKQSEQTKQYGNNNKTDVNVIEEHSSNSTAIQTNNMSQEGLADDALTADIDFNSSMSVEVTDTVDGLIDESNKAQGATSVSSKTKHVSILSTEYCHSTAINNTEVYIPDTEVFTIPETEMFDSSQNTEVDTVIENKSKFDCKIQEDVMKKDNTQCPPTEFKETSNCQVPMSVIEEDVLLKSAKNSICTSELLTSKYTEMNDGCNFQDNFSETVCDTLDQLHTVQETLLLEPEETQDLGNYKNFHIVENICMKSNAPEQNEVLEDPQTSIKCTHSFHSDVGETVKDVKLVCFSHRNYAFIQHATWIQVWRQEENENWVKIFVHKVGDKLQLKEICYTKNDTYLVLVMLLSNNQEHCLQFLLFEAEARVIKLMEHTHWLHNRCSKDSVLLCGLGDLKFAVAQGDKESFEVFVHVFSYLEESPRLLTAVLGSTDGDLKSLCNIEKLPNALMGTSDSMLYVWHLSEARLVTTVRLQSSEPIAIASCIWATIENGLVFFIAICEEENNSRTCQLLTANLATGFCQIVMTYRLRPARDSSSLSSKNVKAVYKEPVLALSCEEGAFLWTVTEEYCIAALDADADVTGLAINMENDETISIAVGNSAGCVNYYSMQCS